MKNYTVNSLDELRTFIFDPEPSNLFIWDIFNDETSGEVMKAVLGIMGCTGQHTYFVATRKPERLFVALLAVTLDEAVTEMANAVREFFTSEFSAKTSKIMRAKGRDPAWEGPLCNPSWVYFGVILDDPETSDARIRTLLASNASKRFVQLDGSKPIDIGLNKATCSCCPERFNRWIQLNRMIRSEIPFSNGMATPGIYRAESNKHGALSVSGVGVKPGEFTELPKLDWVLLRANQDADAVDMVIDQLKIGRVPFFVDGDAGTPESRFGMLTQSIPS